MRVFFPVSLSTIRGISRGVIKIIWAKFSPKIHTYPHLEFGQEDFPGSFHRHLGTGQPASQKHQNGNKKLKISCYTVSNSVSIKSISKFGWLTYVRRLSNLCESVMTGPSVFFKQLSWPGVPRKGRRKKGPNASRRLIPQQLLIILSPKSLPLSMHPCKVSEENFRKTLTNGLHFFDGPIFVFGFRYHNFQYFHVIPAVRE